MKKINLNGTWKLNGNGYECFGTVPGSVYSFLLDNDLMDDPYYRANEAAAFELLNHDYTFSREFEYNPAADYKKLILRCEGLDTLTDIYINDLYVASTKNMHRTYEFDVTDVLKPGANNIKIHIASPNKYVLEKAKEQPLHGSADPLLGFNHLRKAQCMFGWDWGARLPDAGIWRDISIVIVDSAKIDDVNILQDHENGNVYITPMVKISGNPDEVLITATAPDGTKMMLQNNRKTKIENPMLWWPNGLGEQNLYRITTELKENGKVVDSSVKNIGLRTLKLIREKDKYGESFCHEINGIRFFAMGADYIPEDNIFSRITPERTDKLIKNCRDCNFNAIRVWGGGYYPDDFFYDSCDREGLVVFQDMMFACCFIPDNDEMNEEIKAECIDNLKRIRHHACIAVISGNNEIEEAEVLLGSKEEKESYLKLYEDLIPGICKEICPDIPYVSSSPSSCGHFIEPANENMGDSHYWEVWHGGLPFSEYRNHYFRYLSEFGFESFPCEKTLNTVTLPEDRNIFSRVMELHQRCQSGNIKIMTYMGSTFKYPTDFSTLLYASQLLQAEAIKYGVEHMRRHRGRCMGTLYWQLNDIWPVASWASIDYYGRYKVLQYVAKRFYNPVLLSCCETGETTTRSYCTEDYNRNDYETKAAFCVTNDTLDTFSGVVNWELCGKNSSVIESGSCEVSVNPLDKVWLDELDFNKTDIFHNYLTFSLVSGGTVVSEGSVIFTSPKHFGFKDPKLGYKINGDRITITSEAYAKYVEIASPDSDFILSDNYFDMAPGTKTVQILEGAPKTICLRSVYDIK